MLVAALSLVLFAPAVHATCGAEGCPFARDAFGTPAGRFAFDLRYQEVTQDALWNGSHEVALADVISQADVHGEVAHSGMRALYLTPGVTARVARGVSLYGLYQARVWGETDQATVVGKSHFMFGTTYSFGQ